MGDANKGLTKAEAHKLIDERMRAAGFEIGAQIATSWHDLITYPLRTVDDCDRLAAVIEMQRDQAIAAGKPMAEAVSNGLLAGIAHVRAFHNA